MYVYIYICLPATPVPVKGDSEPARHTETKAGRLRSALPPSSICSPARPNVETSRNLNMGVSENKGYRILGGP